MGWYCTTVPFRWFGDREAEAALPSEERSIELCLDRTTESSQKQTIVAYAIPRDDKHNEDVLLHLKYTTCLSGSCHHGMYAGD